MLVCAHAHLHTYTPGQVVLPTCVHCLVILPTSASYTLSTVQSSYLLLVSTLWSSYLLPQATLCPLGGHPTCQSNPTGVHSKVLCVSQQIPRCCFAVIKRCRKFILRCQTIPAESEQVTCTTSRVNHLSNETFSLVLTNWFDT